MQEQKARNKTISHRKLLWNTSNHTCPICGVHMTNKGKVDASNYATIDHIVPKSRGGTSNIENLRLICRKCNNKRGNRVEEDTLYFKDKYGKYIVIQNFQKSC